MQIKNFFIGLIGAAALLVAVNAFAGLQQDVTLNGGTNTVAAVSANTYHTGSFAVTQARDTAFQLSFVTSAAQAGAVTFTLDYSVDNSMWQSNAVLFSGTSSSAATTNTFVFTNNFSGIPFIRLGWCSNACATSYITNVNLKCFTKNGL